MKYKNVYNISIVIKLFFIILINTLLFFTSVQKSNAQSVYGNTISGVVFEDLNSNLIQNAGEPGYPNAIITLSGDGVDSTTSNATGNYSFENLFSGDYVVTLTTPGGFTTTTTNPRSIHISTTDVTVNFGITNTSGNNILNLNFGFVLGTPWFQCIGGDCRIDSGFDNDIPSTADPGSCGGPYASVPGSSSSTPGIIFSGNTNPDFGSGSASNPLNGWNWIVGGSSNPETFTPVNPSTIRTSYSYLNNVVTQSGITPTAISSICTPNPGDCTLDANLQSGIYRGAGGLTLNGPYTFPANRDYVFLIPNNLTIRGNIRVPSTSSVTFSAGGNITVQSTVGEASPSSSNPNIEGFYSADDSFIAAGTNNCLVGPDLRLNIRGAIVVNAGLEGGSFVNRRDMCNGNLSCPSVTFSRRPDLILNAPTFIKTPNYIWQEVAP